VVKSGKKWDLFYIFGAICILCAMLIFTGEYDCRIDAKGRIMLPAAFRKQLGESDVYRFVIKKDMYESCLELFTIDGWEQQNRLILKNHKPFDPEHRQFLRDFRMGAVEVECDNSGRILIPGRLLKQAGIEKEAVLSGTMDKIEIWSPGKYSDSGGDARDKHERAKHVMANAIYNLDGL
jgi:MraZ protein